MAYRAFADKVRAYGVKLEPGWDLVFLLPMPVSWSAKKRDLHLLQPHRQKPDVDNLVKALLDAIYEDDSQHYAIGRVGKFWAAAGCIRVIPARPILPGDGMLR